MPRRRPARSPSTLRSLTSTCSPSLDTRCQHPGHWRALRSSGCTPRSACRGGGQERGLRAGTENTARAVALGAAARIADVELTDEGNRLGGLLVRALSSDSARVSASVTGGRSADPVDGSAHELYCAGENLPYGHLLKWVELGRRNAAFARDSALDPVAARNESGCFCDLVTLMPLAEWRKPGRGSYALPIAPPLCGIADYRIRLRRTEAARRRARLIPPRRRPQAACGRRRATPAQAGSR